MSASFDHILNDLKENKYAPFYFLCGEEPFFIDQITEFIEENALEESQRSFNQMVLYGKDAKMADVIGQAKRFPVMSDRQVVIVKEAQEISDFGKESSNKVFEAYLNNPVPSTILVFAYKYKKVDGRSALGKLIAKTGVYFESKRIYEKDLDNWINYLLKLKGIEAEPKAVFLIAENIGMDLSRVNNELEKIKLSLPKGEKLDEKRVMKLIGISREYNVWELQRAFASGDRKKVFSIINYFEKNPKAAPLPMVMAALYTLFSSILVIQQMNYTNPKLIQDNLGLRYYAAQEFLGGAKYYPASRIPEIISMLRTADAQNKGVEASQMKDSEVLKELALRIMF